MRHWFGVLLVQFGDHFTLWGLAALGRKLQRGDLGYSDGFKLGLLLGASLTVAVAAFFYHLATFTH